jgi:gas vesicle protein
MGDNIEVIQEADDVNNKKAVTLAIGGFVGALVGLAAAYLLWQNAEKSGAEIQISPGEGISLSLLVMGLLRQVAKIGD